MTVLSGIASIGYAVLGVFSAKYGKVSIFTMFLMIGGMFLPYLFGIIFLNEAVSVFKIIGMVILIAALVTNSIFEAKKTQNEIKVKPIFWILCIVAFILNGASSIIVKIHQTSENALSTFGFMTLSSFFTALIIGVTFVIYYFGPFKKEQPETKKSPWILILFSLCFALLSGASSMCVVECAKTMPAVLEYPFQTGGTTILTAILAWIFFKEKQDKKSIVCLLAILAGTIFFIF